MEMKICFCGHSQDFESQNCSEEYSPIAPIVDVNEYGYTEKILISCLQKVRETQQRVVCNCRINAKI